jgi:signal transduction histidine kinase
MAENLERGKITDENRRMEYFRLIGQECRRLSDLISNVLDFSRIEQGRKQYEFEDCNVPAIVERTLQVMQTPATERGVSLKLLRSPGDGEVLRTVDGKALQQALVNLIDNALKHAPPNTRVEVGLEASPDRPEIALWVEDQGPGIPAAEHERIFERFYRLGSELRRETQGVGIGLSIVKHIVEAHGGRIRVRSAPGEGSRFTIELPCGGVSSFVDV